MGQLDYIVFFSKYVILLVKCPRIQYIIMIICSNYSVYHKGAVNAITVDNVDVSVHRTGTDTANKQVPRQPLTA